MSKIKMSDVFTIPVSQSRVERRLGCAWAISDRPRYIAHAINNHDSLVEENSALTRERDFLAETIDQLSEHVGEAELQASGISIKYDSLVEEVERLRGERDELVCALELSLDAACEPYACGEDFCEQTMELLAKIKGEDNE